MRKFGIEIEHNLPAGRSALRSALRNVGLNAVVASHGSEDYTVWQIQDDGSLPADGAELVSPVLDSFEPLKLACDALAAARADIPRRATAFGLHVHIDATDLTLAQVCAIALAYDTMNDQVNAMLPASRRNNRFCQSMSHVDRSRGMIDLTPILAKGAATGQLNATEMTALFGSAGSSTHYDGRRYRTVNVMRWNRRHNRTIEFRAHSGTVDYAKMRAWVIIVQNLVSVTLDKLAKMTAPQTAGVAVPSSGAVPTGTSRRAGAPRAIRGGAKVVQFIQRCQSGTATFPWMETELGWTRDTAQSWASYVRAWGFPLKSIKVGRTVIGYTMETAAVAQARLTAANAATALKGDLKAGLPADVVAYIDERTAALSGRRP